MQKIEVGCLSVEETSGLVYLGTKTGFLLVFGLDFENKAELRLSENEISLISFACLNKKEDKEDKTRMSFDKADEIKNLFKTKETLAYVENEAKSNNETVSKNNKEIFFKADHFDKTKNESKTNLEEIKLRNNRNWNFLNNNQTIMNNYNSFKNMYENTKTIEQFPNEIKPEKSDENQNDKKNQNEAHFSQNKTTSKDSIKNTQNNAQNTIAVATKKNEIFFVETTIVNSKIVLSIKKVYQLSENDKISLNFNFLQNKKTVIGLLTDSATFQLLKLKKSIREIHFFNFKS